MEPELPEMMYVFDQGGRDAAFWSVFVVRATSEGKARERLDEIRAIVVDLPQMAGFGGPVESGSFSVHIWRNDRGERVTVHIEAANLVNEDVTIGEVYDPAEDET